MMGQVRSPLRGILDNKEYHIYAAYTMPLRDIREMPIDIESHVRTQMRMKLADFIARERVTKTENHWSVEYRADLFLFSPDEFWGIVEATAMDLNRQTEMQQVR